MRLPIGIQDFTKLREQGYLYVDKTMHMMPLLQGGQFFFARPRRFGKSLLASTLKAAFSGRKELFKGLWLEDKFDFAPRPVIRIDLSKLDYLQRSLETSLLEDFRQTASEYGLVLEQNTAKSAFEELILELSKTAKVVVLIDEYDKPITDYLLEPKKRAELQAVLKSVYGVLKPMDSYLHTVFLTGVSKIGKLSLFSDLNNLEDISLNSKYALICGYTKSEIEQAFPTQLEVVAQNLQFELPELMQHVMHWYNGYSWDAMNRVYCPFSFLIFLEQQEFKSYWYETGTPTFLVELIRAAKINPLELEQAILDSQNIAHTDADQINPISLMFQTGYLTITQKRSSPMGTVYQLSYPNHEVRIAFSKNLVEQYAANPLGSFAIYLQEAKNRWHG